MSGAHAELKESHAELKKSLETLQGKVKDLTAHKCTMERRMETLTELVNTHIAYGSHD